jgi:hypothetical protein
MPPRLTPRHNLPTFCGAMPLRFASVSPVKARACARSYRLTHGQVNYQPCHANHALVLRGTRVSARGTKSEPRRLLPFTECKQRRRDWWFSIRAGGCRRSRRRVSFATRWVARARIAMPAVQRRPVSYAACHSERAWKARSRRGFRCHRGPRASLWVLYPHGELITLLVIVAPPEVVPTA